MTSEQIETAALAAWTDGYHDDWHDQWKDDYIEGFKAYHAGLKEKDNPHPPSGHERDTTYEDEAHQQWYSGYWEAYGRAHP